MRIKVLLPAVLLFLLAMLSFVVARPVQQAPAVPEQPALTIYNQNFAVVRQGVPIDLKAGMNRVRFTDATAHIEPDSVMLRDPSGRPLQVLEQNYRNDPVSQELLLSLFEGQTIDFLVRDQNKSEVVKGKIIRSGYLPHWVALSRYGPQYYQAQMTYAGGGASQPIIVLTASCSSSCRDSRSFPPSATTPYSNQLSTGWCRPISLSLQPASSATSPAA